MKLENYVLSSMSEFIKKEAVTGKEYIDEKEFERQGFNHLETTCAIKILQKHGITIKKEMITKDDRSQLVRDRNSNDIIESRDESSIADIEYDDEGNIVFEDYSKLDEYIEKEFIPRFIQNKTRINKVTKEKVEYKSIQLNHILGLKLSEVENVYVFQYLEKKSIRVGGMSPDINEEILNYDYISTYHNTPLPEYKGEEYNKELFEKLSLTINPDEKIKIRNMIVENNLRLSNWVAYKYAIITGIDISEINQNAAFGLISAVDNFDVSKGYKFSTYAVPAINHTIIRELALQNSFPQNVYGPLIFIKNDLKRENPFLSEVELTEEALKVLVKTGKIGGLLYSLEGDKLDDDLELKDFYKNRTNISNPLELDENVPDENQGKQLDDVLDNMTTESLNAIFLKLFDTLLPREKIVLTMRFGLDDGVPKTFDQIGTYLGRTRERIRQIEAMALRKLRGSLRSHWLKSFLNYDYSDKHTKIYSKKYDEYSEKEINEIKVNDPVFYDRLLVEKVMGQKLGNTESPSPENFDGSKKM